MTSKTKKRPAHDITIQLEHPGWIKLLRPYCKTVREVCELALSKRKHEMTVVLADDAFIRALNRDYRGQDKATNVLSFPNDEGSHIGDVVLAIETLEREAKAQGKNVRDHAVHLLVHGTLHLLGHDHMRPKEALAMETLEIKILERLGVGNPYL